VPSLPDAWRSRSGTTKVILPVYRTNQMGVMTLRSEADLAALKARASAGP
jgi:hypothetical protein